MRPCPDAYRPFLRYDLGMKTSDAVLLRVLTDALSMCDTTELGDEIREILAVELGKKVAPDGRLIDPNDSRTHWDS